MIRFDYCRIFEIGDGAGDFDYSVIGAGGESEARRASDLLEAQGYGVVIAPVLDDE